MNDEIERRFDAVLVSILDWDRKISMIKLVREITGLELAEAKDFIENLPRTVKKDVSKGEGLTLYRRFSDLGGNLQIRSSSRP